MHKKFKNVRKLGTRRKTLFERYHNNTAIKKKNHFYISKLAKNATFFDVLPKDLDPYKKNLPEQYDIE